MTDPVYYTENNKINVLPQGGACKYDEVQYPAVAYTDSAISVFPDEAEYLVVLYGSVKSLQNVLGKVINPHKAVVYSGPGGFRTFSYTFVMTPESPAEAEMIANIVYFFKYHMHPGVDSVEGTAAIQGNVRRDPVPATQESSTFTYPDEFTIRLFANKQEVSTPTTSKKPALFKINKCFIFRRNFNLFVLF